MWRIKTVDVLDYTEYDIQIPSAVFTTDFDGAFTPYYEFQCTLTAPPPLEQLSPTVSLSEPYEPYTPLLILFDGVTGVTPNALDEVGVVQFTKCSETGCAW